MVGVVGPDQGEAHGQVGQGVGSQQQGVDAQVQLIDAQGAGETLQDHVAVLGQVDAGQLPAQAVVEKAVGEADEEVTLHGSLGLLDVEAVAHQAVQDGLSDGGIVVGLLGHIQGPGAEILAAATAGLVLCVGDLQPGHRMVKQSAEPTVQDAFAVSPAATGGARGAFGGPTQPGNGFGEAWPVSSKRCLGFYLYSRTQAVSFKTPGSCAQAVDEYAWGSVSSVKFRT